MSGASAWVYTKKAMSWGSRAWLLRSYLASRIVADNSEMPLKFFNRPGLKSKVRVIPHGLPLDVYHPAVPPRLGLRQKFGLRPEETMVACVAQLVPVKDHPTLIQAAQQVPFAHFFLAGSTTDTEYQKRLNTQTEQAGLSGRVHFLGNIADIPALLNEADLFVFPTRSEGCPVALLEAMACGKPCIATDIPGSRDLIIQNESGILVSPSHADGLAQALNGLCASPQERARLGYNARKRAESHYSIDREVRAYQAIYAELIR